jgi:pimeloyl-ACP methyl ester carboxylesterase
MVTELRNDPLNQLGCENWPGGKLWIDLTSLNNLEPLYLNDNGDGPRNACDQINPEGRVTWPVAPYENFINRADDEFEVLEYEGYDWRLSLTDAVAKLDGFIDTHVGTGGKVYLVAHSMGGLLARAYVADPVRAGKVAGVVTVGTPYLGAPLLAQRMVTGKTGSPADWLLNSSQVKKIIRYSPGIQQLLPAAAYFVGLPSQIYYLPVTGELLNSYQKTVAYLVRHNYIRSNTLAVAEQLHAQIDGFNRNFVAQGRYAALYSLVTTTPATFRERRCWFGSSICVDVVSWRMGDGTVPSGSADPRWLPYGARSGVNFCGCLAGGQSIKEHSDLFLDDRVIADVLHFLRGEATEYCFANAALQAATAAGQSFRAYEVWGEGRVQVVDAQGRFTGVDENGLLVRDLPDVTYMLTDGGVIITVPSGAAYQVVTYGAGSQPLQIVASDLGVEPAGKEELEAQAQAVFDNVTVAANSVMTVPAAVTALEQLTLTVDTAADGTPATARDPDVVLDDPAKVEDTVMPTTTLNLQGPQNSEGAYTGSVTLSLSATDDNAGVLKSYYSLDGGQTWQEYTAAVQIAPGQEVAVQAYSVDNAGNQEYPAVEQTVLFGSQPTLYLPLIQGGVP